MATNINKIIKTCKPFWPASAYFVNSATVFVNSATVFVNSATPRGPAPAPPRRSFIKVCSGHQSPGMDCFRLRLYMAKPISNTMLKHRGSQGRGAPINR